jgi:hypothetical protein
MTNMEPSPSIDIRAIENYQTVLQRFGSWPPFHDSEIHSILLDRDGPDRPYLEMRVHVFEMKSDVDKQGRYVLDKHTMITMRFSGIESEEIVGFNEQNVIFNFDMRPDQDGIYVEISSSYGCAGSFTCKRVAIKSVEDFKGKE